VTDWRPLQDELDAWRAAGRTATFWWRDDDARTDSTSLRSMLAIARARDVPLAAAVIPADADASLADAFAACPQVTVIQHGYAHVNHAPPGERSAELGDHGAFGTRLDELARGRDRLSRCFGERFAAVLVPPWNRSGGAIPPALSSIGLCGLSCFGPRAARSPHAAVVQVNAHVDPIAWRRDRQFIGTAAAVRRFTDHLIARRCGDVDGDEATGILTHHQVFDAAAWAFVDALFATTRDDPGVQWLDVAALFAPATATCGRSA
jgi:hypothetical protein